MSLLLQVECLVPFEYQGGKLCVVHKADRVSLLSLAQKIHRPVYVYDLNGILDRLVFFKKCVAPARVYYAMKANAHPAILKALYAQNIGVDVVSGGEIALARKMGFSDIVFSGVGKTTQDITLALKENISQFNVESVSELKRIAYLAKQTGKQARVAFRINPNINVHTHPYITTGLKENKFGLEEEHLPVLRDILLKHTSYVSLCGLALHIGSQAQDLEPLKVSIQKVKYLYQELQKDFNLQTFDVGGGLGIDYKKSFDIASDNKIIKEYGQYLQQIACDFKGQVLTEPGRIIVGRFGCLIGQVQYIKYNARKNFVILNTGTHHLMRPCLYQAYHHIVPLLESDTTKGEGKVYDVVGPICESSDVLGRDRVFYNLKEGDFMAVLDAGAYGRVMACTYNAHPLPEELVI